MDQQGADAGSWGLIKPCSDGRDPSDATFEQAAVGIAHVAPDGRWLCVNRKLCRMLGYTREELLALTFQHVTHGDDLGADLSLVKQVLAGERESYSMDKRYVRKDGSL